jgi:hypothetical protein
MSGSKSSVAVSTAFDSVRYVWMRFWCETGAVTQFVRRWLFASRPLGTYKNDAVPQEAPWKRQEESRSVKSARAEGVRDDSIVIAGRWRAPPLMSDRGSRGRSRSCCAGYAVSPVNYESGGQEFESLRARHLYQALTKAHRLRARD